MCTRRPSATRAATSRTSSIAHHDQPAFEELRAARVDDRDARPIALDRLGDSLVPDGVAGEVEVVEDEAADGREQLGDPPRTVAGRRAHDPHAVPFDLVLDGLSVEAERRGAPPRPRAGRRRARSRGSSSSARAVEMIAVTVRDDDGVEAPNDSSAGNGSGTVGLATGFLVFSIGGRVPASSSIGSTSSRLPASSTITVAFRTSVSRMSALLQRSCGRAKLY